MTFPPKILIIIQFRFILLFVYDTTWRGDNFRHNLIICVVINTNPSPQFIIQVFCLAANINSVSAVV